MAIPILNFPGVIARVIVSYIGDWTADTIIFNSECKQVADAMISSNSKYMIISYILPNQIVIISGKKSKRLILEGVMKVVLIDIDDDANFGIVRYELNDAKDDLRHKGVINYCKYNCDGELISKTDLPLYSKITHFTNTYLILDHNSVAERIQFINSFATTGTMVIPTFQVCDCDEKYIVFKSESSDIIVYSISDSRQISKIKFGESKFPSVVRLVHKRHQSDSRYLITVSDAGEMKIYDGNIRFANILIENISLPIKITILEMINGQIIFGNPNKGLYGMYLHDIKNIIKLPINNLFAKAVMNDQSIITIGPSTAVTGYNLERNLKAFQELTHDKSGDQFRMIVI